MAVSVFDLFTIGIGPSSSHTVGPMRAARMFARRLRSEGLLLQTARVEAELFGSLGATGHGHGTPRAVVLGLAGHSPRTVDVAAAALEAEEVARTHRLLLLQEHEVAFDPQEDLVLHRRQALPFHPNGMRVRALDAGGGVLAERTYYSVGGGFVVDEAAVGAARIQPDPTVLPHPFTTGAELLAHCRTSGLDIAGVMLADELAWRSEEQVRGGLLEIADVMDACVERGCTTPGTLPGGLRVSRRAPALAAALAAEPPGPERGMEELTLWAMAVNEENASGGRVVTAPTNGAAGVVPSVLRYAVRATGEREGTVVRFLLTAGAVGLLYKEGASISGAEVGCQGEVGSACSMAAAGLAAVLGGTPEQVENAAEIGMEHNLGLTCDPVGGLVQIPCIERNGMAAVKAVAAARMALRGDGSHKVSLDNVIRTMRQTGKDMSVKYKETSRGGLAVNVIEC
ncbi:L-serine ammonia-lyase [Motilibacter rhizosphaerae]|uniref:L-serine dehydratase n=1 Tax=Motilibacter rhizosphaerae TaxID=598652 RepID=A0A4Q7NQQ1_9ACTN|nr:L-serine ammonia-lyase [Motilibacter rhizosphaerae]RZS87472.1 L-serine ammonia-lyase [Motilibacter rhizosphaerae]